MKFETIRKKRLGMYLSPWVIVGGVVILLTVVMTLAVRNINREKRYMSQLLLEKGAALIRSFEAGARTGMMAMMWGGDQVQNLLEETARQPDIVYLAVTDETGLVLAHSDTSQIGRRLMEPSTLAALHPSAVVQWRLTDSQRVRRVFEVYKYFQPLANCGHERLGRRRGHMAAPMMKRWKNDWCFPDEKSKQQRIIFAAFDTTPFLEARREDIRNTMVLSAVLLLLGFAGFVSLFIAESYRATNRALQDTSAFANEVVRSLPVGLIATDRDGRIAFLNEAAEKITGSTLAQVRGKPPEEVFSKQWCNFKEILESGQAVLEREMECFFSAEAPMPLSVSGSKIINEEGEFVGNILILRDLGEVKRLQAEIRRQEKLAALGNLAAGVAHEIRNPLSSIKGLAGYFGDKFDEGSEDREAAAVMVREVDRLNRVISELLEFARPSELRLREMNVNEVLQHSVRLIQEDARASGVKLEVALADDLPSVFIDPDRFSQAILNLCLNGIQAMTEGGILSISSMLTRNRRVAVEIADTGPGIRTEELSKVFDPYFTTKTKGTGLGLAIVHKIVEAHGGNIKVKSEVGKGALFTIYLPASAGGIERN
ncbi:MAG: PAS domain-containing protein [Deltaproteobacteria bacterium]|nr:PAS domain-containing protein [Deltaproteobacteria bacterium]MBW2069944.1 PAS domain-containing protein [Deltaproteobacteria bacterium]